MAQLIHLRQRIKAIETIKKITHAMRLISMSMHSRLRTKAPFLNNYQQEITRLFQHIKKTTPQWQQQLLSPGIDAPKLIILVGSQKGLCGNFNSALFHFFHDTIKASPIEIIAVGKKAIDFAPTQPNRVVANFANLTAKNLNTLAQSITQTIMEHAHEYAEIIIISNVLKTFFLQRPTSTKLLPLSQQAENAVLNNHEEYIWQEDKNAFLDALAIQMIEITVYNALFQSLLSEQAARFISMDSSTRNAKKLLEATTLQYNKLRQTNITKELTELSSSF